MLRQPSTPGLKVVEAVSDVEPAEHDQSAGVQLGACRRVGGGRLLRRNWVRAGQRLDRRDRYRLHRATVRAGRTQR